ncbi:pyridoxamine 5'-phosphate oxidase family protein [Sneathiella sp.]|jgi:ferredoxin-NADP reductase/predicted pyridoxine 5'-phosphate oxidase superfamily flavin-nucleotide-binding protein|uniref:2Fe-2S iron-sulfur cluster-binding protein n=1 Tax=Sneathiella sp. TaxID=1964365 RepID=UPI0039E617B3
MQDTGWTATDTPFHKGEIEAQRKVGVAEQMRRFARRVIRPYLPDQHRDFFRQLPIVYVGHVDAHGWPWATALVGEAGFLQSDTSAALKVNARPHPLDPLSENLQVRTRLGLLGLEMHTRRRNRLNATVDTVDLDGFLLTVDQSFGNCPQYIHTRELSYEKPSGSAPDSSQRRVFYEFDGLVKMLIEEADTFFVSSSASDDVADATGGVDMSHRGGRPGFVKIDGTRLFVPDFVGNFHFNTIGNFLLNPKAGLLFVDFQTGDMVQLTGTVEVRWDNEGFEHFQGAERGWVFTLEKGIILKGVLPVRWSGGVASLNSNLTGTWQDAASVERLSARKNEWRDYKILQCVDESSVIRSFYLSPQDGEAVPHFNAGQFLPVKVPVEEGQPLIRTYTVSSSPLDKVIRISVKKEQGASRYMHNNLQPGDTLAVRMPRGSFSLDTSERKPAILLSAGVGITPMVSMMRAALQDGFRTRALRPVTLIHSSRNSRERGFFDEIQDLVKSADGSLQYVSLLQEVTAQEEPGIHYHEQGYITQELLQDVLPGEGAEFFLCGPDRFMQSVYDLLVQMGIKDEDIKAEAFGPAAIKRNVEVKSEPAAAEEALVRFQHSGGETAHVWQKKDGTLLEFAEQHGFAPDFSCRNGVCGTCAVPMASGSVVYGPQPDAVPDDGQVLLCCSRPAIGTDDVTVKI